MNTTSFFSLRQSIVRFLALIGLYWSVNSLAQPAGSAAERISRTYYFSQRLVWIGAQPPSDLESQLLLNMLEDWRVSKGRIGLGDLETFLKNYPSFPWAGSLRGNLGKYYLSRGRTTLRLA